MDAPALGLRVLIAKALERYAHFHLVSAFDEPALRLEEVIRIEVDAPFEWVDGAESTAGRRWAAGTARELGAPRSVLLHAVGIDPEQECNLSRVVGVEQDLDLILAVDV